MPDERRTEAELSNAKTSEIMKLMDRLFELSGQKPFSGLVSELQDEVKKQAGEFEKNGMTANDMSQVIDKVPDLVAETVSHTFAAMAASMTDAIKHPDKLQSLMQQNK